MNAYSHVDADAGNATILLSATTQHLLNDADVDALKTATDDKDTTAWCSAADFLDTYFGAIGPDFGPLYDAANALFDLTEFVIDDGASNLILPYADGLKSINGSVDGLPPSRAEFVQRGNALKNLATSFSVEAIIEDLEALRDELNNLPTFDVITQQLQLVCLRARLLCCISFA